MAKPTSKSTNDIGKGVSKVVKTQLAKIQKQAASVAKRAEEIAKQKAISDAAIVEKRRLFFQAHKEGCMERIHYFENDPRSKDRIIIGYSKVTKSIFTSFGETITDDGYWYKESNDSPILTDGCSSVFNVKMIVEMLNTNPDIRKFSENNHAAFYFVDKSDFKIAETCLIEVLPYVYPFVSLDTDISAVYDNDDITNFGKDFIDRYVSKISIPYINSLDVIKNKLKLRNDSYTDADIVYGCWAAHNKNMLPKEERIPDNKLTHDNIIKFVRSKTFNKINLVITTAWSDKVEDITKGVAAPL